MLFNVTMNQIKKRSKIYQVMPKMRNASWVYIKLTLFILETFKQVLWQTVNIQMEYSAVCWKLGKRELVNLLNVFLY